MPAMTNGSSHKLAQRRARLAREVNSSRGKPGPHFDLRMRTMEETVKEETVKGGSEWLLTVIDFASSQQ